MATAQGSIASGRTQKVLTHEVGAGAPCLKCGDKCPGLDLHFWRKICRNCKCPQENHDVTTSVSSRGMDNIEKLLQQESAGDSVNKFKPSPNDNAFIPPATKPFVTKVAAPPPAPKPTKKPPVDVPNTKPTPTPQQNGDLPSMTPNHETAPQKDFEAAPKEADFPLPPHSISPPPVTDPLPAPPVESFTFEEEQLPLPTPPVLEEFEQSLTLTENLPESVTPTLSDSFTTTIIASEQSVTSLEMPEEQTLLEPPTSIPNNNDVALVDVVPSSFPPKKTKEQSTGYKSMDEFSLSSLSTENDLEADYEWTPAISNKQLIEKYMKALPKDKRPIVGSEGAKYRKKQLMRQLPPHDQEPKECHDLSSQETNEMLMFVKQYRQKALGVASVDEGSQMKTCTECEQALGIGEAVIWTDRAGEDRQWHPGCFVCTECKELLVDLIYFYNDNKVYCGRHYCELHKPRCSACDELIFAPEYTQAEETHWHLKHFCCWHCDQPLGGKNYVPHDNQPICIPCYEKTFAHSCATCRQIIAPNTEWVTFEKFHWHARPECFRCIECNMSLVGKPCIPKGETVFCSSKCKREWLSKPQQ